MGIVKNTLSHPSVWPYIHDDEAIEPSPLDIKNVYWLLVHDETKSYGGLFMVYKQNCVSYEVHTCLLPEFRGNKAIEAAKELLKYVFCVIGAKKLTSLVPETNKVALKFALKNGLKIEGVNRKSFLINGALYDQTMVGITFEEWKTCQ